jgi:hypothetical protein
MVDKGIIVINAANELPAEIGSVEFVEQNCERVKDCLLLSSSI